MEWRRWPRHDLRRTCARLCHPSGRPNVTLAASSGFDQPSMIALASNRLLELVPGSGRFAENYRPTLRIAPLKNCSWKALFSCDFQEKELCFRLRSWEVNAGAELQRTTILFTPLSAPRHKLETDWAKDCDQIIPRRYPDQSGVFVGWWCESSKELARKSHENIISSRPWTGSDPLHCFEASNPLKRSTHNAWHGWFCSWLHISVVIDGIPS